ncbi:unnamed protein product [Rhizopus microsporus]
MPADTQKQPVQPRDAELISLILQSLGVEDYDPKVVHQLLEFAHCNFVYYYFHSLDIRQTYYKML